MLFLFSGNNKLLMRLFTCNEIKENIRVSLVKSTHVNPAGMASLSPMTVTSTNTSLPYQKLKKPTLYKYHLLSKEFLSKMHILSFCSFLLHVIKRVAAQTGIKSIAFP